MVAAMVDVSAKLIAEALSWPDVECIPSLANSPDFISIHLNQGLDANDSAGGAAVKKFAQVYMEAPTMASSGTRACASRHA
jgi:hypothetical protein